MNEVSTGNLQFRQLPSVFQMNPTRVMYEKLNWNGIVNTIPLFLFIG